MRDASVTVNRWFHQEMNAVRDAGDLSPTYPAVLAPEVDVTPRRLRYELVSVAIDARRLAGLSRRSDRSDIGIVSHLLAGELLASRLCATDEQALERAVPAAAAARQPWKQLVHHLAGWLSSAVKRTV